MNFVTWVESVKRKKLFYWGKDLFIALLWARALFCTLKCIGFYTNMLIRPLLGELIMEVLSDLVVSKVSI